MRAQDFQKIFEKGKSSIVQPIGVRYRERKQKKLHWGVVVSAKKWKSAVQRNRIKRVLREAVYPLLPFIPEQYDIVFLFLGNNISQVQVDFLRSKIQEALFKALIIKEKL